MNAMIGNALLLGGEGYQISRSVRLRSSASAYLNRTPGSAGNRRTWTWSGWVKRGALGSTQILFQSGYSTNPWFLFEFETDNTIQVSFTAGTSGGSYTSAVFRDPSAWYHIVLRVDTTQATAANRVVLYVNGVQQTFGTTNYPSQNFDTQVNNTLLHTVGGFASLGGYYLDGYLTEVNFIDGQALTPSSFGETNTTTGVWQPKKYAGTYGTNGFYLNFSDNSAATAAAIGKDYSGNGNNWTPNNISVTAGATYDSMLDVPTQWADGGNGRGNYAVLNPLISSTYQTLTNGNLTSKSNTSTDSGAAYSTFSTGATGKWYMEFVADTSTAAGYPIVGTTLETSNLGNANSSAGMPGHNGGGSCGYRSNGQKYISGISTAYGNSFATNDVIGVAVDCDNGAVYFSKNGTWQNSGDPTSGATRTGAANTWTGGSTAFYIGVAGYTSGNGAQANFGQRPFAYTPPTGFKALNTLNLPTPTILKGNQYFDATTYTGTGSSQTVGNGGGFAPDFVWTKSRSGAYDHFLLDSVRGGSALLISNSTSAEFTGTTYISSFAGSGFTIANTSSTGINANGSTYVGWQWKEGATQGFDIVTYTGNGSGATGLVVNHSLGVAPSMMIVKSRNSAPTENAWNIYHNRLNNGSSPENWFLRFDTGAQINATNRWSNITSSSVKFLTALVDNGIPYVAYLFSEVAGFSRFGSYTGNGSADGPFVFCGFRPRFVMFKRTDSTSSWTVFDTARNTFNLTNAYLQANASDAEFVFSDIYIDILSNGFKNRGTNNSLNVNGGTYIFMAMAENPFKNALAR